MMGFHRRLTGLIRLLLIAAFAIPSALAAQDTVAHLEVPDPLIPGVAMEGSLIIENAPSDVDTVTLPTVPGLEWQQEQGSSKQVSMINGVTTSSQTVRLSMLAQSNAPLSIPPITITLQDGSTLHTAALTVKPQSGNTQLTGEAYAEASFDPPTIVPGEPTTLIFRIFLNQNHEYGIKEPGISPPEGAISLGSRSAKSGSTHDAAGQGWLVQTYRWPVTFSTPGDIVVNGQQEYFLCRRDFFGQVVPISSHQIAVKPARLTVTALPMAGRPADFSGLFGPLSVDASLERSAISAGEGTVLALHVHGRQVELLSRPVFVPPPGIQAYIKEDSPADSASTTGARTFRWDLVPDAAGTYVIPSFGFPYFDPATHSYQRARSDALTLSVRPGRMREVTVSGATQNDLAVGQPVTGPSQMPLPLRDEGASEPQAGLDWRIGLLTLALGLCGGTLQRRLTRPAQHIHRGQALKRAVAAHDPTLIAQFAQALLPDLDDADEHAAAERLLHNADLARFGGRPLSESGATDANLLEHHA